MCENFFSQNDITERDLSQNKVFFENDNSIRDKCLSDLKKVYCTGVIYFGSLKETKRCGEGLLKWPDGGFYQGNYIDNQRHGLGKYFWSDGSLYEGCFENDLRHGHGKQVWNNGETYIGQFFNDTFHGRGVYTWLDGTCYNGLFQNNLRSGYGELSQSNGNKFQGIFSNDKPFGPGIYTYKQSGRQDHGIWSGAKLIKLRFLLNDLFNYDKNFFINNISKHNEVQTSLCENQIGLREKFQIPVSFPYEKILNGDKKLCKGPMEELLEDFFLCAFFGNLLLMKHIFESGLVHPDASDFKGHTALIAASINCQLDVLNYLLDVGANINKLTDEKVSPLSACLNLLYSHQNFLDNIAENMPEENLFNAVWVEKKKGFIVCRNEKKMIMSVYESQHVYFKNKHKKIDVMPFIQNSSVSINKEAGYTISFSNIDRWKIRCYKNLFIKAKNIDAINMKFKKISMNSFEYFTSPVCEYNVEVSDAPLYQFFPELTRLSSTKANLGGGEINSNDDYLVNMHESKIVSKCIHQERKPFLEKTIKLLLKRGSDPNISTVPMPSLFFAVKSADVLAVESLLTKNADTSTKIEKGLCVLHIAVALPTKSVEITSLLLQYGADPNARDNYFDEEHGKENGRTALHIVCCREDDYKTAQQIAEMLLQYGANPNLLCCGSSPLSLAIGSGNDLIVETLLKKNANPSLKLGKILGSALCVAASFQAERRRTHLQRIHLIEKLIAHGADMLAPVYVSDKHPYGTVIDYAYCIFKQDRCIAFTPYHALSLIEREICKARKYVLVCLSNFFREAILKKEKEINESFKPNMLKIDAETNKVFFPILVKREVKIKENFISNELIKEVDINNEINIRKKQCWDTNSINVTEIGQQKFFRVSNLMGENNELIGLRYVLVELCLADINNIDIPMFSTKNVTIIDRRKRFYYCYECGRSTGVKLFPCKRCKQIFYCSSLCKVQGGKNRHQKECLIKSL
ncbi:ankyrin repeat and MYND domain-containing protein 1 isoform X1 [Hydra vulgaris]|uniref:ankyrin repeat and MYND domain-containing protein 1 isoform X1 n=2 Tax=Hydra vulgaris TaxID=6087 RepID=UPI001F5FF3EC|nr:ankyrin repeat and MYND domain-containing protein 1 isoform X1 [Hydra vulgaris]